MELLPFLVSEAHSKPLRSRFLEIKTTGTSDSAMSRWFTENSKHAWLTDALLDQHLERGGLPGIGFRREESVRKRMFQAQLDTLLSRDLQLLTQARVPYEKLIHLHRELCLVQGLPINESVLARKVGLTPPSVRKFIDIFSSLFLLRRHGKTLYCEDGGLAEHAAGAGLLSAQQRIRAFLFRELLGRAFYQFPGEVTLAEYRTRGGAEVPFVWTSKKHGTLGFTVDPEPFPGEKSIRSLESFLKNQSNRQKGVRAIAFSRGKERAVIRNGIIVLPLADLV